MLPLQASPAPALRAAAPIAHRALPSHQSRLCSSAAGHSCPPPTAPPEAPTQGSSRHFAARRRQKPQTASPSAWLPGADRRCRARPASAPSPAGTHFFRLSRPSSSARRSSSTARRPPLSPMAPPAPASFAARASVLVAQGNGRRAPGGGLRERRGPPRPAASAAEPEAGARWCWQPACHPRGGPPRSPHTAGLSRERGEGQPGPSANAAWQPASPSLPPAETCVVSFHRDTGVAALARR